METAQPAAPRTAGVFSRRATDILAAASRLGERPAVLLPALYCREVADAILAAGVDYRCYDITEDLTTSSATIAASRSPNVGAIVINHPFGLARPIDATADELAGLLIIEDACHALRSSMEVSLGIGSAGRVVVWSPRKEFGWDDGGACAGQLSPRVASEVPFATDVAARWQTLDLTGAVVAGRRATQMASDALGARLPTLRPGEVLTALPLRALHRDAVIERLRARGVPAWRWIRPLRGTGPRRTPVAWALRRRLFLVPTTGGAEMERRLDLLRCEALECWSGP